MQGLWYGPSEPAWQVIEIHRMALMRSQTRRRQNEFNDIMMRNARALQNIPHPLENIR